MNERMKFVLRIEDGERMSDVCKSFDVSRTTGYKIWKRYQEKGIDGLFDESSAPNITPHKTNEYIEDLILKLKDKHKTWGAQKLREYLLRKYPSEKFPSETTFHNILLSKNLVKKRRRSKYKAKGTALTSPIEVNDLWCTDYKGEFRMKNSKLCYPLTVTDQVSRYLIDCSCLESTRTAGAMSSFVDIFEEYGLPKVIRTDNGVPFSVPGALLGLSKLSVWWLRQGIEIERIKPGCPQENGQHERMHRTLKQEVAQSLKSNLLSQQEEIDRIRDVFNNDRPHQGIDNKVPADLYKKSTRKYRKELPEVSYKGSILERQLSKRGFLNYQGKEIFISGVLDKQPVGLYLIDDNILKVKFMNLILGHIDTRSMQFSGVKEFITE